MLKRVWTHPANRAHRLRAVADAMRWLVHKRIGRGPLTIATRHDALRFQVYPDQTGTLLYYGGRHEPAEMAFMQRYLQAGDRVLDVGAHVGFYSVLAAKLVGPSGHIDAIEGDPKSAARLAENLALNGFESRVTIHNLAASDRAGEVTFSRGKDFAMRRIESANSASGQRVPATTLDTLFPNGSWALGKLDVEGAEPLVLAGASSLIARGQPPVWIIEINGRLRDYGWSEARFVQFLRDAGYAVGSCALDGTPSFDADRPWERGSRNVLAVHASQREAVLQRIQ